MNDSTLNLAVIGAGPVGLALALQAARSLPRARVTLFDARPAERDVSADPRTLALSLGSVQLLQRLGAWRAELAQPILEVHVSQQPPSVGGCSGCANRVAHPRLRRSRADARRGARLRQHHRAAAAGLAGGGGATSRCACAAASKPGRRAEEPRARRRGRLRHRRALRSRGGRRGRRVRRAEKRSLTPQRRAALRHDYRQTAWVGQPCRRCAGAPRPRRRLRALHAPRPGRAAAAAGRRPRRADLVRRRATTTRCASSTTASASRCSTRSSTRRPGASRRSRR